MKAHITPSSPEKCRLRATVPGELQRALFVLGFSEGLLAGRMSLNCQKELRNKTLDSHQIGIDVGNEAGHH